MKRNNLLSFLMAFSVIAMFSSCEHKDLCYHHPHTVKVRVEFDWSKDPTANPAAMRVWFYPQLVQQYSNVPKVPQQFDFQGREGGVVDIVVGNYDVLAYNIDNETVEFRGQANINTFEGYTREGSVLENIYGNTTQRTPSIKGAEEQTVVINPEMLWTGETDDVYLKDISTEQVVIIPMSRAVSTYTYEVLKVKNVKHVTQVCGAITSMAGSEYLGSQQPLDGEYTLPFTTNMDKDAGTFDGQFLVFNQSNNTSAQHIMVFYVWLDDGSKWYYTVDVTDQVDNAPDQRNVHIIIPELELPLPIENGSGFQPSADDWVDIEEIITI